MASSGASASVAGESRVTMRLLELTRATDYELIQENGQRRLTAPEFTPETKERSRGSEIFIGRLPHDCYEDEIVPIFRKIGRLLELRLMLDFSGSTRGYAFALFENSAIAVEACRLLDGYEIRPGHKIGVVKSVDNRRLFFGGVPRDKNKADFVAELGKILDGITDIRVYPDAQNRARNRGFIFVEFKDHRSAAMARRKLIPGRVVLWNHEVAVDWADPEINEPVDEIMESVTTLFIRNLPLDSPHQQIRDILQKTTGIPILKLKKINHFAFVHYENHQLARCSLNIVTQTGGIADTLNWEIRWAKSLDSNAQAGHKNPFFTGDINVASANNQSAFCSKSFDHKKRYKKNNPRSRNLAPCMNVDYQRFLEKHVMEKYNAACRFECNASRDQNGYICKITVSTESEILFQFEGDSFESQRQAIRSTSREVYHHLSNAAESDVTFLPPSDTYNFIDPRSLPSHKIETCR